MTPRIAIPVPHSGDPAYADRALPQYERAIEMAGGEPVRIPLDRPSAEVMKLIESCDAVLLPGSKADVDPERYKHPADPKHEKTAPSDPKRNTVDELLLQDAYNMRKPVLGICYGLQSLNVYRTGTLIQHIESPVNHEAGRKVPVAHTVEIDPQSKLAAIAASGAKARPPERDSPGLKPGASTPSHRSVVDPVRSFDDQPAAALRDQTAPALAGIASAADAPVEGHGFSRAAQPARNSGASAPEKPLVIQVNSSHHQSAEIIGDGLRVVARSPQDGIIEALEGTSPDHFVVAVQWHPERSVKDDESSRAIFRALVEAARMRHETLVGATEAERRISVGGDLKTS